MKWMLFFILCCLTTTTQAQQINPQEEHVASITRIVRHVATGIIAPDQETLTSDQEALITKISQQLIQDAELVQAEKSQVTNKREERKELITTIVLNVAKGIAAIIALLVLRQIIKSMGRGAVVESPDTPLGIIITTRTADQAHTLGIKIIDQELATGGTVTPTIQSFYRTDNKAYAAPEAMLMLKTTNANLADIIAQTEANNTSAPEIIALSRSIIPT